MDKARAPAVSMIVFNSVSHDARVLKEAESLARAGFYVRIFGLTDKRASQPFETLSSGVDVIRVNHRPRLFRRLATLVAVSSLVAAVSIWWAVYLTNPSRVIASIDPDVLMATTLAVVVSLLGFRLARWFWNIAHRYEGRPATAGSTRIRRPIFRKTIGQVSRLDAARLEIVACAARYQTDFVHCHDLITLPAGRAVARRLGAKLIYDSHEIYEELASHTPPVRAVLSRMQRYYSRHLDGFITINDSIAEFLTKRYPMLPPPVIVKNATRVEPSQPPYDGRLHDAAGIPSGVRILLFQGGFQPQRGLESLVRSASLLKPGWCVVLMGWGALEDTLKALANEADPAGAVVKFLPGVPQSELRRWTAGASVGIVPYLNVNLNHWFCTPNKLWEYPAAGVPILASPFPELRRTIESGNIGWLLPPDLAPESIAATVNALSEGDIDEKRRACGAFIERDNWSLYERRLLDLYRHLQTPEASAGVAT